ncbi:hypothetical protein BHE74_00047372 [Ensete ventricosum]|nr:hypothetical protein BHE74_00047372 [Ensete ventricosum]
MIELVEDEDSEPYEEGLELEEEAMEEEPQPADYLVHTLASYSNPQTMKVGGLLKQQSITVLINTFSTNNFLNSKVAACLALQIEGEGRPHACCLHGEVAGHGQAPCRGGRPWPGYLQGATPVGVVARKGRPARKGLLLVDSPVARVVAPWQGGCQPQRAAAACTGATTTVAQ